MLYNRQRPRAAAAHSASVTVPHPLAGRLIGPKGATIQKIQTDSGAKLDYDRTKGVVAVSADSKEALDKAVAAINAIVNPPSKTITCSNEYAKDLIGAGGANVKKMSADSGARISINSDKNPMEIKIEADSPEAIEKAEKLINAIVKPTNAETLTCPPQYVSQVVGEKGATMAEIEKKFAGVKLVIDSAANPAKIRVEGNDKKAVAGAVERVKQIIAEAENPDYEGEEGKKLRAEADKWAKERTRCFDAANKIFEAEKRGENVKKDDAYKLLEEGKAAGVKMEESNAKAVEAIVKFNNKGKDDMYLDLHGLQVDEALGVLEKHLAKIAGKKGDFELIPGAGHHSDGAALIKPKVEALLKTKKLKYTEKNAGTFIVAL